MTTVEVARQGPRPAISLRTAPRQEPPFDDERQQEVWASPHQLAFDWSRQVPGSTAEREAPWQPPTQPVRRPVVAGASGDAKLAVRRFVGICVEVLNGYRPAAHLRRLSQPRDAATVVAQGLAGARKVAEARRSAAGKTRPRRPAPVAVVRLRLCEPRPGAVEAAVVLVIGDRTWAMALRLELHQESWVATTLCLI
jgi:hypothetical protein